MGATRSMRHDSFKAPSKLLDLEAQRLARLPNPLNLRNDALSAPTYLLELAYGSRTIGG